MTETLATQTSETKQESKFDIEKVLDKVIKYLPLASVVILIGGILRLITFYHFYKINITEYIELSEIVILFLNDLLQFSVGVILMLPIFLILLNQPLLDRIAGKFNLLIGIFIAISISCGYMVLITKLFEYLFDIENAVALIFGLIVGVALIAIRKAVYKDKISRINVLMAIIMLIYIITCIVAPIIKVKYFTEHNSTVVLNDKTINANGKEYLVGFTKSYIFLYNDSSKLPEIYPIGNLKYMVLGKLPYNTGGGQLKGEAKVDFGFIHAKASQSSKQDKSFDESFDSSFGIDTSRKK